MGKWYSVKILFQSVHTKKTDAHLNDEDNHQWFEESIILLHASSVDDAEKLAITQAIKSEHTYQNSFEETVSCHFERVIRVYELNDDIITDGTEVYSNFIVAKKSDSVENVITRYYTDELDN